MIMNMLVYLLIALSIGCEGGFNNPVLGFQDINPGPGFAIFASRDLRILDITMAVEMNSYSGKNPAYGVDRYGVRLVMSKHDWLFAPLLEVGGDYISRKLKEAGESGYAITYGLGFMINFRVERLRLYPKLYYDGLTDFRTHAGLLGIRMGISYEI
jgi:hypothetical protein